MYNNYTQYKGYNFTKSQVCWWCCYELPLYPVFIPLKYDEIKDLFNGYGYFCSFNCAKAFNNHEPLVKKIDTNSLINFMAKKYTKQIRVEQAPSRLFLEKFGGPYNIQEFRKKINLNSYLIPYPMEPMQSKLQTLEIRKINNQDLNFAKLNTENTKNTKNIENIENSENIASNKFFNNKINKSNNKINKSIKNNTKFVKNNDNTNEKKEIKKISSLFKIIKKN